MPDPATTQTRDALRTDLVSLICEVMRRDPASLSAVSDATPCVGGPLLADSLDVLEFVVAIDRVYGVSLRDGQVGRQVLTNMGSLTNFVAENRVR
jgi:acyl carrier protein